MFAAVAGSQVLPPGTDGPASDCAGQVPIVVGSDAAAQSDLYSAATLAGVIDTSCIVLAGPRDGEMDAAQVARLDAALGSSGASSSGEGSAGDGSTGAGWVMGGEAAVSSAKVAGRNLKRLNGVDRWHTARLAGAVAVDPDGDIAALTAATAPTPGEAGGSSVTVDGAEVRLPPGLGASCAGQVPIVVAADAAAQSDLYSAATLAGVLDTSCIVLAGARDEPMSTDEFARVAAANADGYVVGGEAAVPSEKVAAFTLTRIGGADRWHTARLIGEAAVAQAAAAASTTTTTEAARSTGSSSSGGGGSARSSGGGGGSSRRVSSGGGGGVSRPPTGPSSGPSTGTPAGGSPTGTTSITSTTMPGDTTGTTQPGSGGTTPGDGATTRPTEPPRMASMFSPSVAVEVPRLVGTSGANIWADATFVVTLARASGADDECSLMSSQAVTFTVQADGSVTDDGSVPSTLIGTTAADVACAYTVTFPAPPVDSPGGDFDWAMSPAAATEATLSDASPADNSATGAYTVGAVTFAPDATITVPTGSDGAAFDVDFASSQANCSGSSGAPVTLTYTVRPGGTTAQPATPNSPSLVAYPAGATPLTAVCSYAVTFPPTEADGTTLALQTTNPAPSATVSGTARAIVAAYALTLKGVSSGETFSCALQSDGAVFCWGDNGHGQLVVPALTGGVTFTQVSAGSSHACALKSDGTAACWGDNTDGRTTVPDPPQGVAFTQVSAGWQHSCGLKSDGEIACWGRNTFGQATVPTLAGGDTFTQVSAGEWHSCAVKSDQSVVCWGESRFSRVVGGTPTGSFVSVSAGSLYACGVRTDRSVECWGDDNRGSTTAPAGSFVSVSARSNHACGVRSGGASDGAVACWGSAAQNQLAAPSERFAAVSAGASHSCGLKTDGSVACWGHGNFGQAGAPAGTFAAVTGGAYHSCGITTGGATQCWGANDLMQGTVPTLGAGVSFTQVSAGVSHTCGVRSDGANDGTVACWGDDGSIGAAGRVSDVPSGATDLFTWVSAGGSHSCGIRSGGDADGQIACWGADGRGQLVSPDLGPGEKFTAVGAGSDHTCALKSDASVACWGYDGVSGDGRVSATPRTATDLFASLGVGGRHACAVRATGGTVTCWGSDGAGQSTPPAGAFSAVAAGDEHTCGIRSVGTAGGAAAGTVVCWGSNAAGQTDAPEGTFSAVTAGRFHTCGIRSDRAAGDNVVCWGAGTAWQRITARPPS